MDIPPGDTYEREYNIQTCFSFIFISMDISKWRPEILHEIEYLVFHDYFFWGEGGFGKKIEFLKFFEIFVNILNFKKIKILNL